MTSFDIIKNNNYDIVLIEKCPCNDKEELHKKERFYIENMDCINKIIPTRTSKEYRENNRDMILVKKKEYRKQNAEKIKQYKGKVCVCEICNCNYTNNHKSRHLKTKKHQDNLNKQ
jgi:hypothetical protein